MTSICNIWLGRNEVITTSLGQINHRDENRLVKFAPCISSWRILENNKKLFSNHTAKNDNCQ